MALISQQTFPYLHPFCPLKSDRFIIQERLYSKGARDNDYLHEEALAYELAAEFFLLRGFEKIGISYLIEAHYGYQLLQTGAKVQQLEERYPQWLTKRPPKHQTPSTLSAMSKTTQTEAANGGALDLGSLLKASQAISSEIILSDLLEKMMKIVIENAGAERGLLLLSTKDQWLIEAESSVYQENPASSPILQAIPIAQKPLKLSTAIVHYVIRTKQALILNDALHEGAFQQDHYVRTQQPKSILCMPLLHQGQVKGLLYLENNLNRGTFTPDRVELLRLLSSQMTVSLDNARLYNHLEELVEQRTIELREAKKEAEMAKEKAEAANQAKSDFLSSMSHELRTPLNGILGYAQLLKRDQVLKPKQKNYFNVIHESGNHLLTLINDILDLSKIEARKMDLYPQDVHLSSLLKMVQGIIRMRAEEKQVRFVYEPDETLPAEVQADEKRLRQVLINLLGNAVKFTERGQVTLKVSRQHNQSQNQVTLRFEIIDTGVGMTPEQLDTIFLPFEQVGEAKQHAQGTGLGLAITRQLLNLMGSEVFVSSELGKGSRFWFDLALPLVEGAEKEVQIEEERRIIGYQGQRRKVLVVDDKAQNRHLLRDLLTPLGFEIIEAENGQEEVELARQIEPDLILTDLLMPVMGGFEAVKAIRQFDQEVPIIAISVNAFASEQQRRLEVGCNAFLSKPVEARELLALIEKQLALTWQYEESPTENPQTEEPALIAPPQQQLKALYEAAMLGMMSQIRKQMHDLEQMDSNYAPFANKVRELARAFEDEEIVALVERYLNA